MATKTHSRDDDHKEDEHKASEHKNDTGKGEGQKEDERKAAERKKYEAAARKMPIGTVVWYWSAPMAEPQAAILAGREIDGEHCNLLVISNMGVPTGRQNVLQAKAGDDATGGEYFQEAGAAPLEVPQSKDEHPTTDTTRQKVA